MDTLCLLHDSDEYGVLRWPLIDIANALGIPCKLLEELEAKGVLKGGNDWHGEHAYTPVHARVKGAPVVLLTGKGGPCWFSSRMVDDEYLRHHRGLETRFKPSPEPTPSRREGAPEGASTGEPKGASKGDGASSSSSSSSKNKGQKLELARPTDQHRSLANDLHLDCDAEFEKYRDNLAANGKSHKDEAAGFRNWLRRSQEFKRHSHGPPNNASTARRVVSNGIFPEATNERQEPNDITGEAKRIA